MKTIISVLTVLFIFSGCSPEQKSACGLEGNWELVDRTFDGEGLITTGQEVEIQKMLFDHCADVLNDHCAGTRCSYYGTISNPILDTTITTFTYKIKGNQISIEFDNNRSLESTIVEQSSNVFKVKYREYVSPFGKEVLVEETYIRN